MKTEISKPCVTKEKLLQVAFDLIWNSSYGSVSVGDICDRAGVNKGSFYHFFKSKTDLVVQAHEEHWKEKRPVFDAIFSSQVPPLERLHKWCEFIYEQQKEMAAKYGHVCGCPYASIGAELATQDEKIRAESQRMFECGKKYVESAIADAVRDGDASVTDPIQATHRVCSVVVGMMVEAKVNNSLDMLKDIEPAILAVLGARPVSV